LGNLNCRAGEFELALRNYQESVGMRPGFADAFVAMANVFDSLGRTAEAVESCQRALAIIPRYAEVHFDISQIATSKPACGGRRKLPWAFTEHGAIQAANVLNFARAISMGVYVARAFVQLRDLLASNKTLAQKLSELEHKLENHDEAIAAILSAIRELLHPPVPKRRPIGFTADLEEKS
jgi:tetratricopeptide (TPR) repeat protein